MPSRVLSEMSVGGAFRGAASLRSVKLNESLSVLGEDLYYASGVFADSGLESVRLPSALKRLEVRAFKGCRSLRSVRLP